MPEESAGNNLKRRKSLSRILQKLRRKSKRESKFGVFQSLRSSSTNVTLPSANANESASLIRRGSFMNSNSIPNTPQAPSLMSLPSFIALATYECVYFELAEGKAEEIPIQGRLHLTDQFILFDSKTLTTCKRFKLDWREILSISMRKNHQEEFIIQFNVVQERYIFGRFLEKNMALVFAELSRIKTTFASEGKTKILPSKEQIAGPHFQCGCFIHYPHNLLAQNDFLVLKGVPFEIFQIIHPALSKNLCLKGFYPTEQHKIPNIIIHLQIEQFHSALIKIKTEYFLDSQTEKQQLAKSLLCLVREDNHYLTPATQLYLNLDQEFKNDSIDFLKEALIKDLKEKLRNGPQLLKVVQVKEEYNIMVCFKLFWTDYIGFWGQVLEERGMGYLVLFLLIYISGLYYREIWSFLFPGEISSPAIKFTFEMEKMNNNSSIDWESSLLRQEINYLVNIIQNELFI